MIAGMPEANPFDDDDYDPKLLWLRSNNDKPPWSSWDLRLKLPESLRSAVKGYLVRHPHLGWIDPQGLIRAAIYHGLHHMGKMLDDSELLAMTADYRAAVEAGQMLRDLTEKRQMMDDFREVARTVDNEYDARVHSRRMEAVAARHPDPRVVAELRRLVDQLKGKM